MIRRTFQWGLVALLLILGSSIGTAAQESGPAVIVYYNAACASCEVYVRETLTPTLAAFGVTDMALRDYINDRSNRPQMNERIRDLDIPIGLQSHLMAFVGDRLVLAGHIPVETIRTLMAASDPPYDRMLVYQDEMPEMGDQPTTYKAWAFRGPIRSYDISTPITTYLDWFADHQDEFADEATGGPTRNAGTLLPIVLSAGLLDGVNPCAIAVLLFFIAFLFTLQRARSDMLLMGGVYIAMVFLVYVAIGLGLMSAIVISGTPHLLAQVGAWLLIALGLINVKDFFWYGRGPSLSVPTVGHEKIHAWLKRATLPAVAVAGLLVGLCTFPCSGGIYVAILGLLADQGNYLNGIGYLLVYNVMFVAPLIVLLLGLGNRRTVGTLARWQAQNKRTVKLATGAIMIALGAVILVGFV